MAHHEEFDPGSLYDAEWVQTIVDQIQDFLQTNIEWLGILPDKPQRLLDYACGNGTCSLAFLDRCQQTTFQGIDSHPAQVERFNKIASDRLGGDAGCRMWAVHGDLSQPSAVLEVEDWSMFDVAIISMALHHVKDPRDMLNRLRQRLRPGGKLVVVEMIAEPNANDDEREVHGPAAHSHHAAHAHASDGMVESVGGQKIWAGLTTASISAEMEVVGFSEIDGRSHPQTFTVPVGPGPFGTKRLIFVTGVA